MKKSNLILLEGIQKKVTVIIPAYNEEENIQNVIRFAKKCENVDEIIVVDNCSTDNTYKLSKAMGVKAIKCVNKGKGYAMEKGFKYVRNPIVVFLDADINYQNNTIEKLVRPIIDGKADFVKSTFKRQAGRVTELSAKPLLRILYPAALSFSQPLSGMIAGKREFFKEIYFEKNYGVDIGILIDMIGLGARIKEVNIGKIENKMKKLEDLSQMANEVVNTILNKTMGEAFINNIQDERIDEK